MNSVFSVVCQFTPHSPLLSVPPPLTTFQFTHEPWFLPAQTSYMLFLLLECSLSPSLSINYAQLRPQLKSHLFTDPFLDISDDAKALGDELLEHHVPHLYSIYYSFGFPFFFIITDCYTL